MKHPLITILIGLLRKCFCCAGAVTEIFLVDRVVGGVQLIISIHYPPEMATNSISLWPSSLTKSDLDSCLESGSTSGKQGHTDRFKMCWDVMVKLP